MNKTGYLGDKPINRVGFGAMQLAGPGVFGPPRDPEAARAVLRRAIELGVDHIDTAQYYGPDVVNDLIRDTLRNDSLPPFDSLERVALPAGPLHLAIGMFDGVHLGHQSVIAAAIHSARRSGGLAGVLGGPLDHLLGEVRRRGAGPPGGRPPRGAYPAGGRS